MAGRSPGVTDDLCSLSLVEAAAAIQSKQVSSEEMTQDCLGRAEALQPVINCFISLEGEDALVAARAADQDLARGTVRGPLHGVPLAHKDLLYRAGKVMTGGSKILADFVPDTTATVLERLSAAGAINLGTLNMAEFALGAAGRNEHFGPCRNPWNPDHISGGSSSGSGAAVAGGIAFGAIGTDTGGSIRLPATICGVVGMKPTQTRVSRHGVMPLSYSLDNAGPLTRTVADCARMLEVIAGADPNDPTSSQEPVPPYESLLEGASASDVRIGVPVNHYYDVATGAVKAALAESLEVYRGLGAEIVEITVPGPTELRDLLGVVLRGEAANIHAEWLTSRRDDYAEEVRTRIEAGLYLPAVRYLEAMRLRPVLLREFLDTVYDKVDVLHLPGLAIAVPTIAETDAAASGNALELNERLGWCTRAASYLGLPSLAVPCGFADGGLPVGFQLMGRPYAEDRLLSLGHAYQRETAWHTMAPVI
jgi:aspartyl-tRNA(Asn)/glutamyl-tRNA(Gln) amidotransferase subunit A